MHSQAVVQSSEGLKASALAKEGGRYLPPEAIVAQEFGTGILAQVGDRELLFIDGDRATVAPAPAVNG